MGFIVKAKIIVKIALAVQANTEVSHTPSSFHIGDKIQRNATGNTIVPKNDVSNERTGRSIAVKKDEKHISTHPVR